MVKAKFLRRGWTRYAKLGRGVKKNQKWRKPTGRDNKMRENKKGKPIVVTIGHGKKERQERTIVQNIRDLEKVKTKKIILGKIGKKKKIEIALKAKEKGIKISNLNVNKFLKKQERKKSKVEENKK